MPVFFSLNEAFGVLPHLRETTHLYICLDDFIIKVARTLTGYIMWVVIELAVSLNVMQSEIAPDSRQ